MCDRRAGIMQASPLSFIEMNAVTKHGALADQAIVIINIQIIGAFRKKFLYPGNFIGVFRNMRLQVQVRKLTPQRARCFELCR